MKHPNVLALAVVAVSACSKSARDPAETPPANKTAPPAASNTAPSKAVQTTPKDLFADFNQPNADKAALMTKYSDGVTFTAKVVTTANEDIAFDIDGSHQIVANFTDPMQAMTVKLGQVLAMTCKIKQVNDHDVFLVDCTAKPGDPSAAPPENTGPTKLDQLEGLTVDFVGGVDKVMDEFMIKGPKGALFVEAVTTPQRLAEAKSDADAHDPHNYKQDKLPDGYAITYDNAGTMGANYFVEVQRKIGGKVYHCSTIGKSSDEQQAVLAACKTMRR
jgi:hypothetical protein